MTGPAGIEAYRDRHSGAKFVVCGCGGSLSGFEPPPGTVTIGVNDMGRAFDPDYLLVLNGPAQFSAERFRHIRDSGARAIFSHLDLGLAPGRVVRFRLGRMGGTDAPPPGRLHHARNSPYAAVHLAVLMGAARIGLIGVDFTDDHFFSATGPHALARSLPRIDAEYAALAGAMEARGILLANLSPISRITSLPRMPITAFCKETGMSARRHNPDRSPLTLSIPRQRPGPIGALMDALATSALSLGDTVRRGRPEAGPADGIAVTWNGRNLQWPGPVIYCEHGWLPRTSYQISTRGINADSHAAPFVWDGRPLAAETAERLDRTLTRLRKEALRACTGSAPDAAFLLVPLQMEYDTNITRHAPPGLRRMQALVDVVSAADPPYPLVFKQHPADAGRGGRQLALTLRRKQDRLWPHGRGDVHALLGSGRCRGIVTINSNVAHDGLIHDVPAVVLGRNVWPQEGATPFLTALPRDWNTLEACRNDPGRRACRDAYAHHLIEAQWSLADARSLGRLADLLESLRDTRSPIRAVARTLTPIRTTAPAHPRRIRREARGPQVNIFARNRGWRFEEIKAALLARARRRGIAATASNRPEQGASAWIAVRTSEAGHSPDPARTVVQVHDMARDYSLTGKRSALPQMACIQLVHSAQLPLLDSCTGLDRSRILPVMAPGARTVPATDRAEDMPFVAGWFGRPERHEGRERHRAERFVCALCEIGPRVRALLVGEGLEPHAALLRDAGIAVTHRTLRDLPMERWPEQLASLDVFVSTGDFDPAPQLLFDALAAGVPVVAPPFGWAADLLTAPGSGIFATSVPEISAALEAMLDDRTGWIAAADARRKIVRTLARDKWLDQSLDAALALAELAGDRMSAHRVA
jgi:glycosyltransferase involved in cell wall biosynthesis